MIRLGSVADNTPADTYAPSWWDYLFAGKPAASKALNPIKAAVGVFTPEVDAVENAIQPITPEPNRSPGGAFDQALNQGGQDDVLQNTIQQFQFIVVDASVIGPVPGYFPADVDGNTLAVVPRAMVDEFGTVIETASDAVLFFKINQQSNLMLPLSYSLDPGGQPKNSLGSIQGNIRKLWLYVSTPAADPNRKYVLLALMKDVAFSQPGGAGSFSTATVSSSGATSSVEGGGGGAPGPAPAPAPAPSGGGTGGTVGTGGSGGSGGGGLTKK